MRPTASATAAAVLVATVARALDPAPVALQASDWLGIDGNWSTVSFLLGSNADVVNVLVSTTLSEFWAVGPGACIEKDPRCTTARGGIYNPTKSKHWSPMKMWQLGLKYLGFKANGEYGLDTINAYSPITDIGFGMSNVVMSAINTSNPFLGLFGLGIEQGKFGDMVADSPMTQAVKTFGWIPSYSYGFTAGAHYRNTIVSATLGGYDAARFVPHDTTFSLTQSQSVPQTLVRGIQIAATGHVEKPDLWSSRTEILSDWNSSFTAMIDSSTPYLWLPEAHLYLYTLPNELYRDYTSKNSLKFTFSLTSFDNHDNFGLPLEVPGLVNITLPLQAFVGLLEFPFNGGAIKYGDPAVPYFMLRNSSNNTFVIGRSFLQESYLVTKFDEALYSIHQALFPAKPEANAKLVPIKRPNNSPYPAPPEPTHKDGVTTTQMVGIALGAVFVCVVILIGYCCCRRRRRRRRDKDPDVMDDNKDSTSTLAPDSPRTPVSRILSKIGCRKQSRRSGPDVGDGGQFPSEAPDCQIYELPAPVPPAELDAGSDDGSFMGETELGTDNSHSLSAYEVARRKLDRQLQGPVPEYTPPVGGLPLPPEKAAPDPPPAERDQVTDHPGPISPIKLRGGDSNSNSFPVSEPSPISPTDSITNSTELPSPIAASMPTTSIPTTPESQCQLNSSPPVEESASPSASSAAPASQPAHFMSPPSASFQRAPIDPSRIVCLGPLPSTVQSHRQTLMSGAVGSDRRSMSIPITMFNVTSLPSEGSLGSNYTEEEERYVEEITRQASLAQGRWSQCCYCASSNRAGQGWPSSLASHAEESPEKSETTESEPAARQGCIDPGKDLVHVPQMAEKRYSWEEGP